MDTLQKIHDYFWSQPQRIVQWGFRLAMSGMVLLASGLTARLLLVLFLPHGEAGRAIKKLDALLPYFPTWWIPESWFGYFFAISIIVTGLIAYGAGKRLVRVVR